MICTFVACPKCGREMVFTTQGRFCPSCGYDTIQYPGQTFVSSGTGRVVTGEQSVMEDLVEMVEELYARIHTITGQDELIESKLKMCRKKLGMEEEE